MSGDGPNNSGPLVVPQRDDIVAAGITINGLPLMLNRPNTFSMDIADLDIYFEDCVIGGPGAFVIAVRERAQFKEAIRTKLILEIAELRPRRACMPAQARSRASPAPSASRCGASAGGISDHLNDGRRPTPERDVPIRPVVRPCGICSNRATISTCGE